MNAVEKLEYRTRMQKEWLNEYNKLKRTIEIVDRKWVLVAYTYEGMGVDGYPTKYVERYLNNGTRLKLLNILIEELKDFEEKGFEKWLEEKENENE